MDETKERNKQMVGSAIFISIILLIMVVLAFYSYCLANRDSIFEQNKTYVLDNTAHVADIIDNELEVGLNDISSLSAFISSNMDSPNFSVDNLQGLVSNCMFDCIEFVDANGNVHGNERKKDVKNYRYYSDAMNGNSGLELVDDFISSGGTYFVFYSPVYNEQEIVGSIVGAYEANERIASLLHATYYGGEAESYLCDSEGKVIASSIESSGNLDLYASEIVSDDVMAKTKIRNAVQLQLDTSFELENTSGAIKYMPEHSLYLISIFPESVATAMIKKNSIISLTLVIFLMLIYLACAIMVMLYIRHKSNLVSMQQEKINQYNNIINALASDYGCVYEVDLDDESTKVYKMSGRIKGMFDDTFERVDYKTAVEAYVSRAVHDCDKERLQEAFDINNIREYLAEEKSFTRNYLNNVGMYTEMKVVRIDGPFNKVVMGFGVKDAEIRSVKEKIDKISKQKEQLETQQAVLKKAFHTAEIFKKAAFVSACSYFLVDLTNDEIISDIYGIQDGEIRNCTGMFPIDSVASFTSIIRYYNSNVIQTNHEGFGKIANTSYLIDCAMNDKMEQEVVCWVKAGGKRACHRHTFYLSKDENTQHYYSTCIIYDVTEKECAEENSRKRISNIMNLSDDFEAIYEIDYETGEYVHFSENGNRQISFSTIVNNGGNFYDDIKADSGNAVFEEDVEKIVTNLNKEKLGEILSKRSGMSFDYRVYVNGVLEWYRAKLVLVNENDNKKIIMGIFNINEKVREEREREQALKEALALAQSANRAKTTFLNNMSHDIRTPMNAIIGYTDLAKGHIDNTELVESYLSKIAQSSDHLLSLINDVLDMSRIESGKMNLNECPEKISDIIHTLKSIVQVDIKSKNIEFQINTDDVRDEAIMCDKLRVNQVLLNVLSNAVKYTQNGGKISLGIKERDSMKEGYALYEFVIKDNGMGMSKEFLSKIFEPFTRVKNSTVSGIQGTGLGMAITKNIVDMMNGRIQIDSEEGEGTTVKVEFTFKLANSVSNPNHYDMVRGRRALVIDDDMASCIGISKMLDGVGFEAQWCVSGKEAVFRAEESIKLKEHIDLFIIDWQMPDLNGIETARRIRKVVGSDAKLVILSAYDCTELEDEGKDIGIASYISKPLFPSDVYALLDKCYVQSTKKKKVEEKALQFEGKRVLLVEDNEMNLEIGTDILQNKGFIVSQAQNGKIAVEMVKNSARGDFDLILMDIQMPIMDGYEATKAIRALDDEYLSKIPIIAMTANAYEEDRQAAMEAGMNEHISKPINQQKMRDTIAKFV